MQPVPLWLPAGIHTPQGRPRTARFGEFRLELGGVLPELELTYETYGEPRSGPDGQIVNAVLILHALTGDAHVTSAGPQSTGPSPGRTEAPRPGWWDGLIGAGRAIDTDQWFVIASNVLGGCDGSTGPASPAPDGKVWGSRFPRITVRDQVRAETLLADHLDISRYRLVVGGSMGGMRALEWVIGYPDRVEGAFILATGAAASADQIGTQSAQISAILADPDWAGGDYSRTVGDRRPDSGLALARRIAHLTYRSAGELEARFANRPQDGENPLEPGGRFAVQSYLEHQGRRLSERFDAGSYVALTDAMNTHDVGRGRGGVAAALGSVRRPVAVAGIDTDRLYPLGQQQQLHDLLPGSRHLHVLRSKYGHDGFLLEIEAVGRILRDLLGLDQSVSDPSADELTEALTCAGDRLEDNGDTTGPGMAG